MRAQLQQLEATGRLDVPLPSEDLRRRWRDLFRLGAEDLSLARLAEGHVDAVAVLAELEHPAPRQALLGVWASRSERTGLCATPVDGGGGWRLDGTARFCSGARSLDAALITAEAPDGLRLFLLRLAESTVRPVEGTWAAMGMAASDSLDVEVTGYLAPAEDAVGGPGAYLDRAGFWIGGIGVAAVWAGGLAGIVDDVRRGLAAREPDAHQLAHPGACVAAVRTAEAVLDAAAAQVLAAPDVNHRRLALECRHTVEQLAQEVITRAGRATGATPLCRDAAHARRVADLSVYVRQSQAERDLETLGRYALTDTGGPVMLPPQEHAALSTAGP